MSDLMAADDQKTRRELLLGMIQQEYPSYHPLVSIARIAHHHDADLKLQFECHRTIAKYVEPELKSIEVKGEITGRHKVSVSLFEPKQESFPPVSGGGASHIEGESTRVLPSGQQQSGGEMSRLDMDPSVVDRVTLAGWE
ncbi:hypothetical protein [Xanthomonas phage Xp15]|uniref:Uncharacterized protein n=1 Tax=Xanthomonas phage Xp15 TaxID=322855 RepID=Q52PM8_9CAUD|nr:hypothetical protein XPXV15_gp03 [Xanthomonas phage Xp15]AAX84848.1 hypothetical protein [Xanthomonas phage Xp15]